MRILRLINKYVCASPSSWYLQLTEEVMFPVAAEPSEHLKGPETLRVEPYQRLVSFLEGYHEISTYDHYPGVE